MDLQNLFKPSPNANLSLNILNTIGSVISLFIFVFVICFIITLLCLAILYIVFEFMFKLGENFFPHLNNELMDLERRDIELCHIWPGIDDSDGRKQSPIDKVLPPIVYKNEETNLLIEETCSICLDEYENGESCRLLPSCKHMFHSDCLDTWLKKSLTCPVCRQCILTEA